MNLFDEEMVVSKIILAMFMPKEKGAPIHKNRPSHGLVFNVDCSATYRFESGEVLTCGSGECIYLPKGSNYTAERTMITDTPQRGVYAINFLLLNDETENKPFVLRIRGRDEMISLFSKAETAWRKKGVGFYEECMIDLYKIIRIMKKETSRYSSAQRSLQILAPALEYIKENYTNENIPLSRLASICNISQPYLRKLFQNAFSVSPAVYMRNLRIKYAKELLSSGEYSVTDAAMLAGFNDISYFSREFKNAVGVAPSEYRQMEI